jgi:20S proteasome subunit beta 6
MFSLNKSYSVAKREIPDLFPQESIFKKSENQNSFKIAQTPIQTKFTSLPEILEGVKPTKMQATEEDLYEWNGGTTLTISVENKIIVASDTRHSGESTINSRNMTKIYKIGDYFLTTVGFYADGFEVYSKLLYEVKSYETYNKLSLKALAHLLHNILYTRRFFPYYTFTCLSGFVNGEAKIYCYDPIGSYQETKCRCDGTGSKMIQPLLDSWVMGKNFKGYQGLNFSSALELVKKAFDAAAERDVKTKDYLEIYVIEENAVHHEFIDLRKD